MLFGIRMFNKPENKSERLVFLCSGIRLTPEALLIPIRIGTSRFQFDSLQTLL